MISRSPGRTRRRAASRTSQYIILHYITLHRRSRRRTASRTSQYIILPYITLHYMTLHYIADPGGVLGGGLRAVPRLGPLRRDAARVDRLLHQGTHTSLQLVTLQNITLQLHCIASSSRHSPARDTPERYITLHYIALHCFFIKALAR